MEKHAKIYVPGHAGMVGSAICRALKTAGYDHIIQRSRTDLDLECQNETRKFFEIEKPDYVFLAAARVGGILANSTFPAEFIYQNLMVQNNIIHAAHNIGVKKLLFLGSSCIYPRNCPQPMKEEYLLTDKLETTNEAYAIAKIAGIKMCQNYFNQYGDNFISVMPTNLYGPNDNYDLKTSHVLPALIRKFHEAKVKWNRSAHPSKKCITVKIWGTGTPRREFLHVNDAADACVFIMNHVDAKKLYGMGITHLNIGSGEDVTIAELADIIKQIVGFQGRIEYDSSKPDGTLKKLLDVSQLSKLGWKAKVDMQKGIADTYDHYLKEK